MCLCPRVINAPFEGKGKAEERTGGGQRRGAGERSRGPRADDGTGGEVRTWTLWPE